MIQADIATAVAAYKATGSKAAAARLLGIPTTTLKDRLAAAERPQSSVKGRKELSVTDGVVAVFSDAHYWPGVPSVAHRALVKFCKDLVPQVVVCNGDAIDGACISRFPSVNWASVPTVKEELEVCQERLGEIVEASGEAVHIWALGNHDARYSTRLAQVAPEFKEVHGVQLSDHFPAWANAWSLWINDSVVIKHRFKSNPLNSTIHAGLSTVTGHLHRAAVTPFTDYRGVRYGVDTGCLADIYHEAFQNYCEDNPRDWRAGFCILTFKDGKLLMPELVLVWDETHVQFRGEIIEV
jgi:hypothetical protein